MGLGGLSFQVVSEFNGFNGFKELINLFNSKLDFVTKEIAKAYYYSLAEIYIYLSIRPFYLDRYKRKENHIPNRNRK